MYVRSLFAKSVRKISPGTGETTTSANSNVRLNVCQRFGDIQNPNVNISKMVTDVEQTFPLPSSRKSNMCFRSAILNLTFAHSTGQLGSWNDVLRNIFAFFYISRIYRTAYVITFYWFYKR